MVRARIWLTCAAAHDPVSPILIQPAVIGWEAKRRRVELTIEKAFKGPELLARMKGWVTSDVDEVAAVLGARGRIKLLDERRLVWEGEAESDYERLVQELDSHFNGQVGLERMN